MDIQKKDKEYLLKGKEITRTQKSIRHLVDNFPGMQIDMK